MSRHDSKQIENVKVMLLKGESGSNIASIEKTGTSVLVDTYTVTLTDGSKTTFTVTNGKGITSIEKTDTQGLVDTYTITFNDSTTGTFTVTNGNGIASIEKTDTQGLVDTYTITFDDGTTETFDVTNGENGTDASLGSLAPIEETSTASQAYAVGEHLVFNGYYYIATQAIAQGDTITVGTNIQREYVGDEIEEIDTKITQKVNEGQSNLARIEETSIASQSYSVNSFLVNNGILYKVTQAIANGGTISEGVNVSKAVVTDEFLPLNTKGSVEISLKGSNDLKIKTTDTPNKTILLNGEKFRMYENTYSTYLSIDNGYGALTSSGSEKYLRTISMLAGNISTQRTFYLITNDQNYANDDQNNSTYLVIMQAKNDTSPEMVQGHGLYLFTSKKGSYAPILTALSQISSTYATVSATSRTNSANQTHSALEIIVKANYKILVKAIRIM